MSNFICFLIGSKEQICSKWRCTSPGDICLDGFKMGSPWLFVINPQYNVYFWLNEAHSIFDDFKIFSEMLVKCVGRFESKVWRMCDLQELPNKKGYNFLWAAPLLTVFCYCLENHWEFRALLFGFVRKDNLTVNKLKEMLSNQILLKWSLLSSPVTWPWKSLDLVQQQQLTFILSLWNMIKHPQAKHRRVINTKFNPTLPLTLWWLSNWREKGRQADLMNSKEH